MNTRLKRKPKAIAKPRIAAARQKSGCRVSCSAPSPEQAVARPAADFYGQLRCNTYAEAVRLHLGTRQLAVVLQLVQESGHSFRGWRFRESEAEGGVNQELHVRPQLEECWDTTRTG